MAKRKRLSPATITTHPESGLETKAHLGWVGTRRPPIADVSHDAASSAAFEEVAAELESARSEGRMITRLALDSIEASHLVRDRLHVDPEEMEVLKASLRARGQQTPIEVEDLGGGRYGLISGWRRLMALRELQGETGEGHIQALIRAPEAATDAYKAMVEENEIRASLSFYERARIAVQAARQGLYKSPNDAVQGLFSAATPSKRSKIVSFAVLAEALDEYLRFPAMIPEKLGLALASALKDDPAAARRRLYEALRKADVQDAAHERRVLERALSGATGGPKPKPAKPERIAPGVKLASAAGKLTLSGKGVDAALIEDIRVFLRSRS
jgi:ParB-like chromosome segregation protein Spo0J